MDGEELLNLKHEDWRSFVYLSESPVVSFDEMNEKSETGIIFLANTKVGDCVRIVSLNCGEANNRLMGMGLMPGMQLTIVSSTGTGSVIVAFNEQRLGLGADMAQQIQVRDVKYSATVPDNSFTSRNTTMKSDSNSTVKLRNAAIGSVMKVIGYEPASRDYKRKLLAMGLTPNTEFTVTRHAPLGDPTEIEVRGFRLSLRKAEADALIVELI